MAISSTPPNLPASRALAQVKLVEMPQTQLDAVQFDDQAFAAMQAAAAAAPLTEIIPATAGHGATALGFALAWVQTAASDGPVVWITPQAGLATGGGPHAEGVGQFGMALDRLLLVRPHTQADALWASEVALTIPHAVVLCIIAPTRKPLGLTATRRLLLAAERHRTRCVLLRLDAAGTSAAWTRWRIATLASQACSPGLDAFHELGPPAFAVQLERSRIGPAGLSWHLHWNAREHGFRIARDAMDGAVAAALADRPGAAGWRRTA